MKIEIPMELNQKEEIFTHKDDDGTIRHFPSGAMNRIALEYAGKTDQISCVVIPLCDKVADHIRKNMGIEQSRIDRLVPPYIDMPIIGILWEDDKSLTIIDGNHRYLKLIEMGRKEIRVFAFKQELWEQMLLPLAIGEDALHRPSGVIEYDNSILKDNPNIHTCHVTACFVPIDEHLLMCKRHWSMVPYGIRRDITKNYKAVGMSDIYIEAVRAAMNIVRRAEDSTPSSAYPGMTALPVTQMHYKS